MIASLALALLAISPTPWSTGLEISSVKEGSAASQAGITAGEQLLAVNTVPVMTTAEYQKVIAGTGFKPVSIELTTTKDTYTYESLGSIGIVHSNLTVKSFNDALKDTTIGIGEKILKVNGQDVTSDDDLKEKEAQLFEKKTIILKTDKQEYAYLTSTPPEIRVEEAKKSNINKGLELEGGTRVLLSPKGATPVTDQQIQDVIAVLNNRLNTYGVSDIKIRAASDLEGSKFIMIEIAGASREEVRNFIAKQGKFEAKIGDDLVFTGGAGDIKYVCRNDASCSGIRPPCNQAAQDQYTCTFQFSITLSEEAAQHHADITDKLEVNFSEFGGYLSKTIDFYLDDQLVDSLQIASDLKGTKTTQIAISGPGFGTTEQAAYEDALDKMNRLQTILITGSLPVQLEIVKFDTISPILGQEFIKNSFLLVILAVIGISLVIITVYRKLKIIIPMIITIFSEILLTLGVAAIIQWNLDLASIAGIIAAVGTGIDDQIVITDEILKGEATDFMSWKEKIKRAFAIIISAYIATAAAMIPLWFAGAGLIRGFAVTTIIGITVGVFITRPAYGSMIGQILGKEEK